MSVGPLVKSTYLLDRYAAVDDDPVVEFWTVDGETQEYRGITIPVEMWRDMGSPTVMTVTVEPGDTLNAEADE